MEQHSINFSFEARYFQLGKITSATRDVVFVLHGYGQHAKYFLRKFSPLESDEMCVIAPEGLSRFYLEGFSGRVGATWMTKEDRLTDIKNYITYLNAVYRRVIVENSDIRVSVIGFSQGAATASRWVADGCIDFHKLILWAGIFPPDMDFEKASSQLRQKSVYYVYGTEDPFLSQEKLNEMKVLSAKLEVKPQLLTFKGGHDIDSSTLQRIFQQASQ